MKFRYNLDYRSLPLRLVSCFRLSCPILRHWQKHEFPLNKLAFLWDQYSSWNTRISIHPVFNIWTALGLTGCHIIISNTNWSRNWSRHVQWVNPQAGQLPVADSVTALFQVKMSDKETSPSLWSLPHGKKTPLFLSVHFLASSTYNST